MPIVPEPVFQLSGSIRDATPEHNFGPEKLGARNLCHTLNGRTIDELQRTFLSLLIVVSVPVDPATGPRCNSQGGPVAGRRDRPIVFRLLVQL